MWWSRGLRHVGSGVEGLPCCIQHAHPSSALMCPSLPLSWFGQPRHAAWQEHILLYPLKQ